MFDFFVQKQFEFFFFGQLLFLKKINKWYEPQGKPWTLKNRCKHRGTKPNIPPKAGLVQLSILIAQLRYFSKQSFTNKKIPR